MRSTRPPDDERGRAPAPTIGPRARRRRRALELARWAVTAAVVLGAVWLFRQLDLALLLATLRGADLRLLALAVGLNLTANLFARASRWRALLPPSPRTGRPPRALELAPILLAMQAALNVFPFRAGEAVRVLELRRRHGYAISALVSVTLAEKLVEATTIALYVVPVLTGLPGASAWVRTRSLGIALAALALATVAIVLLARATSRSLGSVPGGRADGRAPSSPPPLGRRLAGRAGDVLRTLGRPGAWARAGGWSIASDACDVAMILLCLRAVGVDQPFAAGCAILLAINLAIAIPSTPAQLGAFEAGALFALARLGVRPDVATAFALLYHAAHVVPTTLLGGLVLLFAKRERPRETPAPFAPRASAASGIDPPSP